MAATRPNFLILMGEDTGRYYGCYGDAVATTPHLDRLASEGCRYDQAYSTCPVCAPARSTVVTGQYPMKIGTHQMRSRLLAPPRLFTHELRDAGYFVNWSTKLDFNFEPTAGWRDDSQDWVEQLASGALPRRAGQPWMLYMNFGITHESSMWPIDETSPGRPKHACLDPQRPPAKLHDPAKVVAPPYLPDTSRVRADIARHYDNLAELDRQVGRVLAALEQSGEAANTFVIYLADHGRGLPREKRWPYTAGIQEPLVIRGPGVAAGTTSDELVSWVDIAPTILSLAGAAIPASYDGRAFLGAAGQPLTPARQAVFAGRDRMDEAFDRVRVVRDKQWHYVKNFYPQVPYAQRNRYMEHMPTMQELRRLHAAGALHGDAAAFMQYPKPAEELYDLASDPWCVHNVADDPANAGTLARMRGQLAELLDRVGDKGATPERELIEQGLVEDQLTEYRARMAPLPAEHQFHGVSVVLEAHEADAIGRS